MYLTVKLYGTLRRFSGPETPGLWQGEAPDGLDVRGLIAFLGTHPDEVAAAARDGEPLPLDAPLSSGDVIMLVTPFGGG